MTVKEKIMEALGGAIKDASRPMAFALSDSTVIDGVSQAVEVNMHCEFDWAINLEFKDGSPVDHDDFYIQCGSGSDRINAIDELAEATGSVWSDGEPEMWPEVYNLVKENFDSFLNEKDDRNFLHQPAEELDLKKSNFFITIYEVIDDGADVCRYHWKAYYFHDLLKSQ